MSLGTMQKIMQVEDTRVKSKKVKERGKNVPNFESFLKIYYYPDLFVTMVE